MSDLNQRIRKMKSDVPVDEIPIHELLERWKSAGVGPLCCTYTMPKKYVGGKDQEGYVDLADFQMADCQPEEYVIGCSRGCIPVKDSKEDDNIYGSRLCEPCVEEAKKVASE